MLLGDINDAAGAALAAEIGERAAFRHVDVRECAQVERWVAGAVAHVGRVDVLLNNAGIGSYGKTPDVPPELWRAVMNTDRMRSSTPAAPPSRTCAPPAAAASSTRRRSPASAVTTASPRTMPPKAAW